MRLMCILCVRAGVVWACRRTARTQKREHVRFKGGRSSSAGCWRERRPDRVARTCREALGGQSASAKQRLCRRSRRRRRGPSQPTFRPELIHPTSSPARCGRPVVRRALERAREAESPPKGEITRERGVVLLQPTGPTKPASTATTCSFRFHVTLRQPASKQAERERESISIDRSPGVCGWLLTHPPHLTAHHESYASTPRTAPLPIVAVVEEKLAGGDAAARLT